MAAFMGVEHGSRVVSLFISRILAIFGCPLGSIWAFLDLNKIITLNYFHGSGMAALMCLEHGFKVRPLYVSKIMAKKANLAAHWSQPGNFGI